jgi:hypothetical protein
MMGFNIAFMPRMPMHLYAALSDPDLDISWLKWSCFLVVKVKERHSSIFSSVSNPLKQLICPSQIKNLNEILSHNEILEIIQYSWIPYTDTKS